jgi:hypothetical protein
MKDAVRNRSYHARRYSGHDLDKRIETFGVNESPQWLTDLTVLGLTSCR